MITPSSPRLKPALESMPIRGVPDSRQIRRLAVATFLLLICAGIALHAFLSGPDMVALLGLPIGWAGVMATAAGLRRPEALLVLARKLANDVRAQQIGTLSSALLDDDSDLVADLALRLPSERLEPILARWRCGDGGPVSGAVGNIDMFFDQVGSSRLVILGNPGSGKSVLASAFVRDRIERILADHREGGFVVPVLFDLASWEPARPDELAGLSSSVLARTLDLWLVDRLAADYDLDRTEASRLVNAKWVLPVLDCMDELDPADSPTATRHRAKALLRALNHAVERPVILVSRLSEYLRLAECVQIAPGKPMLRQAQHVIVRPVAPREARTFLTNRIGRDGDLDAKCALLRTALTPGTTDFQTGFAKAVADPTLLTVLAFLCQSNDPAQLLPMSRERIRDFLLAALIPSVTTYRPCGSGPRQAQPEQIVRWLARIAEPLPFSGRHRLTSNTIYPDTLWPAIGWRLPRFIAALSATVPFAVLGLAGLLILVTVLPVPGLVYWTASIACGLCFAAKTQLTTRTEPMKYIALRRLGTAGGALTPVLTALAGLVFALLVEPMARLALASPLEPLLASLPTAILGESANAAFWANIPHVFSLPYRIAVGLMLGLAFGLDVVASPIRSGYCPSIVVRRGVLFDLIIRSLAGLTLGVGSGLTFAVLWQLEHDPAPAWVLAGLGGLAGMMASLASSRWLRYLVTALLGTGRRLPWRQARFLDWGHQASVFRLAGSGVQFRSNEFRMWLQRQRRSGYVR